MIAALTENLHETRQGLVISYYGSTVSVEDENGRLIHCHLRRNQALPVVGDRVEWQPESVDKGIVTGILPRVSELSRGDARGRLKPIAANVDFIIIVMAPTPIFSEYLTDRYLIAAELLHIPAIIILNKCDLLTDANRKIADDSLRPYSQIPYPVICTSVMTKAGLPELNELLKNKTAVLVGPSGVGKSSIIAALSDQQEPIRIGDVSAKGTGKHTTTATRLYHLNAGGSLIDSPGVREFNLWPVNKAEILQGFKEFGLYIGQCKFRDCQHLAEPGCAVQAAAADAKISPQRYASYQALMKETSEKVTDTKKSHKRDFRKK